MAIEIKCHECGEEFRLKDTAAGKKFKCKVCGASLDVPDLDDDAGDFDDELPADDVPDRPVKKRGNARREEVASRCLLPAIFLYILGTLSLLNHGGGVAMNAAGIDTNPFAQNNANEAPEAKQARLIGTMVFACIFMGLDIAVLYGAFCLHRMTSHSAAMTAAIISCIPICSPCLVLGIPFGIWALVVLNKPEVKKAFLS
jgi:hypothetical protein